MGNINHTYSMFMRYTIKSNFQRLSDFLGSTESKNCVVVLSTKFLGYI